MDEPLVSAVITTKNRADLLPRALESVHRQSYSNIEIIVVDDGSTDDTAEVLKEFAAKHAIIQIHNETSQGACRARNQGIEAASGEFIAGLDDDDQWHPRRVELLLEAYRDDFSCVASDVELVYPNRTVTWKKEKLITYNDLLYSNQVGNQVLVKKERLQAVGGFDESLAAAQDYDLWLRLSNAFGPVRNVNKPLQKIYMQHGSGQISNTKTQLNGYLSFYEKHKAEMNFAQQRYQLFNIRRVQGKVASFSEIFSWVPPSFWMKEIKRHLAARLLW